MAGAASAPQSNADVVRAMSPLVRTLFDMVSSCLSNSAAVPHPGGFLFALEVPSPELIECDRSDEDEAGGDELPERLYSNDDQSAEQHYRKRRSPQRPDYACSA